VSRGRGDFELPGEPLSGMITDVSSTLSPTPRRLELPDLLSDVQPDSLELFGNLVARRQKDDGVARPLDAVRGHLRDLRNSR
jgi:hypothetical protein